MPAQQARLSRAPEEPDVPGAEVAHEDQRAVREARDARERDVRRLVIGDLAHVACLERHGTHILDKAVRTNQVEQRSSDVDVTEPFDDVRHDPDRSDSTIVADRGRHVNRGLEDQARAT